MQLMLVGDEHLHYFVTRDGQKVMEDNDGKFYYAVVSGNTVIPSKILAHEQNNRTPEEVKELTSLTDNVDSKYLVKSKAVKGLPRKAGTASNLTTGSHKVLNILVSFNDLDFAEADPKTAFYNQANEEGYSELGHVGSIHDYFYDSSDGQLDLQVDVAGPYKAPQNMSYYGGTYYGVNDYHASELVSYAVRQAAQDVNLADYDWDGDGYVDQVFVTYAGYAESSGAPANTIWPHQSQLYYPISVDGVMVSKYACASELAGASSSDGTNLDGIGTFVHEFSHCLGLPDFYDTNSSESSSNYGMFVWDVMDQGCYGTDASMTTTGNIPVPYTPYEKEFMGWSKPLVLDTSKPCKISDLGPYETTGKSYKFVNPGNENEYFLVDYVYTGTKWTKGIRAYLSANNSTTGGVLITHVTYDANRWNANTVNASGQIYQCMTPVLSDDDADNRYMTYNGSSYINPGGILGDLWTMAKTFSSTSTPAITLNTRNSDGSYTMDAKLRIRRNNRNLYDLTWMDGTQSYEDVYNDATGISGIKDTASKTVGTKVYNLNGQFVGTSLDGLQKGIYIQNGKKVVVK